MISRYMEPKKTILNIWKNVSLKCRENGVSLNLEKCYFCVNSERLLGHGVCKEGLLVDPKNVVVIKELPPPTTIWSIHSFLGQTTYQLKFIWM